MTWETVLAVATAIGGPTTVGALYKWARAQGRADALAEQGRKALIAKDTEITEMRKKHTDDLAARDAKIGELEAENARLWSMLEALTTPPEAS